MWRAWDQSVGNVGDTGVDTTAVDPATGAFSTQTGSFGIEVLPRDDAPVGADNTVSAFEDTAYHFAAADFGFSDPYDSPANVFAAVKITTLPAAGILNNNGGAVTAGDFISITDIDSGQLVFTPALEANGAGYASFTVQVQDDGAVNLDPTPNTITVDVIPVNDAPAGADKTISIAKSIGYKFVAGDFGFSDANDSPADGLAAVKITTLPAAGILSNDGQALNAGDFVSAADIVAGKLVFTPAPDGSGYNYASFTFQVQDAGGTANQGIDLDPEPNTITLDVTTVIDLTTLSSTEGIHYSR